ncbi:MAG: helix-turn-helix domain-containing protein [Anaerolineaceae bacterium]
MNGRRKHPIYQFAHWRGDRQNLHVSRAYAYQLMRQRIIPTVKIGRSVRVRPADLEEFIARNLG